MNGQCLYAAVLQLLCQVGDNQVFFVPAKACLHRHGRLHRLYHLASDVEHQRNIPQHTRTGTLPCHLLHRTAKVQVDDVGTCFFHNSRCLYHLRHVAPVDLYANRPLLVADGELANRRFHRAHQRLGRHKLGIDHSCPKPFAEHTKANIRDILHRCQKQRPFAKINCSYFHALLKIMHATLRPN